MMFTQPGQWVDRYQLVRPLGSGGQAQVWQAVDPLHPDRYVALKMVDIPRATPVGLERARREAHLLMGISHPALVRYHRLLEEENVRLILVMDLAEGRSLDALLSDPRMTQHHREAVLRHLAEVLAVLHQAGIVHRDLKPENVVVSERFWQHPYTPGVIKLVDLGISVRVGNPTPLTQEGRTIGTPPFMAPERIVPLEPGQGLLSTPQSDVFAWGLCAWLLLDGGHPTGLPPDASLTDFALAYQGARRGQFPWPLRPLRHDWAPVVVACLQLDPAQRPANGAEIFRDLLTLLHSSHNRTSIHTQEASFPSSQRTGTTSFIPASPAPPSSRPLTPRGPTSSTPTPLAHATTQPGRPSLHALHAPLAGPGQPPSPLRERGSFWLGAGLFLVGLLFLSVGLMAWVLAPPGKAQPTVQPRPTATSTSTAAPPRPTAAAPRPSPQPRTPRPAPHPPAPEDSCVCSEQQALGACTSRRTTLPGLGCKDALPTSNHYYLRLSYASTPDPQDPARLRNLLDLEPGAHLRVCTLGRPARCHDYPLEATRREPVCRQRSGFSVSVADLTRGLLIEYIDQQGVTRDSQIAQHQALGARALCDGLIYNLPGDRPPRLSKVGFYLDE